MPGSLLLLVCLSCSLYKTPSSSGRGLDNHIFCELYSDHYHHSYSHNQQQTKFTSTHRLHLSVWLMYSLLYLRCPEYEIYALLHLNALSIKSMFFYNCICIFSFIFVMARDQSCLISFLYLGRGSEY